MRVRFIHTIFTFFALTFSAYSQGNIIGVYYNSFGSEIEMKSDSTFHYTWRFDLSYSCSSGYWRVKNDTVYFDIIVVYDTLKYYNENRDLHIDTLVKSVDCKSSIITSELDWAVEKLTSGGQNEFKMPPKLFYNRNRLYHIDSTGKLIKRKRKGFWTGKKYRPWYLRKE